MGYILVKQISVFIFCRVLLAEIFVVLVGLVVRLFLNTSPIAAFVSLAAC